MGCTQLHECQVMEVLFDADQHLTPQDWQVPAHEASRHIPSVALHLLIPAHSRRSSAASSTSSPLLLSPTESIPKCAWDASRHTAPRPTSTFLPSTRGLDEAALFLAGAPGAEEAVRRLARELKPFVAARRCLAAKLGRTEVTETMQIQRLREEIARAESGRRTGLGAFRGLRKRFQLV